MGGGPPRLHNVLTKYDVNVNFKNGKLNQTPSHDRQERFNSSPPRQLTQKPTPRSPFNVRCE